MLWSNGRGGGVKVAVFGASGRTGRLVVERALEAGHEVRAFVRGPAGLDPPPEVASSGRLEVVRGDVTDAAAVEGGVAGVDAVLSALGHTKTSTRDVHTVGTRNIVAAMEKHGAKRLVSLTGAGVRDHRDRPKFSDRAIVFALKLLQGRVLRDAEGHARILDGSGLDWIIVRAPMLTDGEGKGEYRVGYVGKNSGSRISRADVADFMLAQLEDRTYLRRAPMVSY